jgi:hypothetical protein
MWGRVLFAGLARAVLLFGVAATSALSEKARAAGAAYVVDTADVSEPGACKVESWISTASNRDFFAATTPTCVVDVFRPRELSSQLIRTRADTEWVSGIAPKIKTNLVPTAIGSWGIAISGLAVYDFTNQQTVAMFATVPATLRLSNRMCCGSISTPAGNGIASPGNTMRLMARAWTGARRTMSGR